MGYGMGAAIGAAFATGQHTVLITGDGSFGMNLNELATAVTYKVPVLIVLMDNTVLGMVRQWQMLFFDGRCSATQLDRRTDFVKLAEAFGAKGERISTAEEFRAAFARGWRYNGPYLIHVPVDKDEFVLPMIPAGGSLEDLITSDERKTQK
jgi:acetolactate synthase-1/2/3 large subunit